MEFKFLVFKWFTAIIIEISWIFVSCPYILQHCLLIHYGALEIASEDFYVNNYIIVQKQTFCSSFIEIGISKVYSVI